jgi:molybdopterin-synthase adenylyltransferase
VHQLTLSNETWVRLDEHFRDASPSEDGAFMLLRRPVRGRDRVRHIVVELLLPDSDAWESRGAHRLRPSGQWLSAVIGQAIDEDAGLAFVHSHPNTLHPASLSPVDRRTSVEWSRTLLPTLQAPFASLVWTPTGLGGWVFDPVEPDEPVELTVVEALGAGRILRLEPAASASPAPDLDDRQARALGELGNARLRDLSVAVVGAGGTGSPLVELLGRVGVRHITVIDEDRVDTDSNLRRIVGSTPTDLSQRTPKVIVAERHLREMGLGTSVAAIQVDVRSCDVTDSLLDADVIFSTTDTHSSRAFLNQLAVQYCVPFIDVGVKVGTSLDGGVSGMPTEIRVVLPDSPCLWCEGVLDAATIRAENLPPAERASLAAEGYVQGVEGPQPSLAPLNTFAASLAMLTLLRLWSRGGAVSTRTIADGWEQYFADAASETLPSCPCHEWRAMGDAVPLPCLPARVAQ